MTIQSESLTTKFIPLTNWNNYHPWPPIGGLRHIVFYSKTNGFAPAIKRCGRRVLIDEKKFFEILEATNQGGTKNETI